MNLDWSRSCDFFYLSLYNFFPVIWLYKMLCSKWILCPVHLPIQNIFCLGQNQTCPRRNNFVQDKTFFCPGQKLCPLLETSFPNTKMIFKPWTKFLSSTKCILSQTNLFCLGQIWFCPRQKIFCPGRWTVHLQGSTQWKT